MRHPKIVDFCILITYSSSIVSLDSIVVIPSMVIFRWANYEEKKGKTKMHTLLSMKDFLPINVHVSDGKVPDNDGPFHLLPKRRSVIAADRGMVIRSPDKW